MIWKWKHDRVDDEYTAEYFDAQDKLRAAIADGKNGSKYAEKILEIESARESAYDALGRLAKWKWEKAHYSGKPLKRSKYKFSKKKAEPETVEAPEEKPKKKKTSSKKKAKKPKD